MSGMFDRKKKSRDVLEIGEFIEEIDKTVQELEFKLNIVKNRIDNSINFKIKYEIERIYMYTIVKLYENKQDVLEEKDFLLSLKLSSNKKRKMLNSKIDMIKKINLELLVKLKEILKQFEQDYIDRSKLQSKSQTNDQNAKSEPKIHQAKAKIQNSVKSIPQSLITGMYIKVKPGETTELIKDGLDEKAIREAYSKLITLDEDEFMEYFEYLKPRVKSKIKVTRYSRTPKPFTKIKLSLKYVINSLTDQIPSNRLKKIDNIMPILHRVYFGPILNHKVYRNTKRFSPEKYPDKLLHYTVRKPVPKLETPIDLAIFLNMSVNQIMKYCYTQKPNHRVGHFHTKNSNGRGHEAKNPFYNRMEIPKQDGSKRIISEPCFELKQIQRQILEEILELVELDEICTGFVKGKSIVDNAKPHIGANILVKMDLKNFFPSLKFYHVFEVFRGFGYNRIVSGILACLCTDYADKGRFAPQGAPTSPMIGNLYASKLDRRIKKLWEKRGYTYTRYADDLTFSSKIENQHPGSLICSTYKIIEDERLRPNERKTKIFRKGQKMHVTGIVVNEKLNIDQNWFNKFKGELYYYNKNANEMDLGELNTIKHYLRGKYAFLNMINQEKANKVKLGYPKLLLNDAKTNEYSKN